MKTTLRKNSILTFIIVSCIIALAFGIRYLHLVGDPPVADISRSGVFYMDEGTPLIQVRRHAESAAVEAGFHRHHSFCR